MVAITERFVQTLVVESGDVLDDGQLELRAASACRTEGSPSPRTKPRIRASVITGLAHGRGQGTIVAAVVVVASLKPKVAENGKPPAGQVSGRVAPFGLMRTRRWPIVR